MFIKSDDKLIWQHIRRARAELFAYLESLSQDQWNHASLCDGWRVRDVVGHLIVEHHYTKRSWTRFVRDGMKVNTFLHSTAVDMGNQPISDLLEQFRLTIDEQRKTSSISAMNVLVDLLIHEQDISIPLGDTKNMDLDSLRLIFSHWEPGNYNFGEKVVGLADRLSGLQFTITDLELSKGGGAEVIGNAQDILLAVVGRRVSIDRLNGEGSELLRDRIN